MALIMRNRPFLQPLPQALSKEIILELLAPDRAVKPHLGQ